MIRLIAVLVGAAALAWAAADGQQTAYAIDGDTIAVGSERVRLLGVDTPELHGACPAEIAAAERARRFTAAMVRGGVTLERRGVDRYGRTLAVVRVGGRDVAEALIAAGLGRPYGGGRRGGWC